MGLGHDNARWMVLSGLAEAKCLFPRSHSPVVPESRGRGSSPGAPASHQELDDAAGRACAVRSPDRHRLQDQGQPTMEARGATRQRGRLEHWALASWKLTAARLLSSVSGHEAIRVAAEMVRVQY